MNKDLMGKAIRVLFNEGPDVFMFKIKNKIEVKNIYKKWIETNEKNLTYTEPLEYNPLFSVVIPVYNVEEKMLTECIESVLNQSYRNFELILVDDASTMECVGKVLKKYENYDKITVIYHKENGHISKTTNDGIEAAKGEFISLCDCDDLYAPNALYEVAKKLNEDREYDFIYSDEDKIDENSVERRDPFFKPDWSPETFMSYMYTCHLAVYRTSLIREIGGLRVGFEGSQDYDLVLRVMEKTEKIGHVSKILYHWRMRKESTASDMGAKPYVLEATKKAKEEALQRRGLKGELTYLEEVAMYRVTYKPEGEPLVSIVIPSKDNPDVLEMCLNSVTGKTKYKNYEIIVVDNGSNEENKKRITEFTDKLRQNGTKINYIYEPMKFNFSHMCNTGAKAAEGKYILFLNDDIEVSDTVKINPRNTTDAGDWLEILLGQASVSYTGAVGCKLYYPDSIIIQHAGVVNYEIGPGHCFYGIEDTINGYWGRNILDYNFTVVTGACLMVDKEKFEEVGGFDEDLSIAYNDVALCFALQKKGYHNVLRNDVTLVHHESVSRGLDSENAAKEERRKKEMSILYDKHPEYLHGFDPCYNPNLAPDKGDFSFNMKYINNVEKIENVNVNIKDKPKGDVVYNIETFNTEDGKVVINGWAYKEHKKNNNRLNVKIVLIGEEEAFTVDTIRRYRGDVAVNAGRKGCTLTGFDVFFEKSKIKPGTYNTGLLVGNNFVNLERNIIF